MGKKRRGFIISILVLVVCLLVSPERVCLETIKWIGKVYKEPTSDVFDPTQWDEQIKGTACRGPVYIHNGPDLSSRVIGQYSTGEYIIIRERVGGWGRVLPAGYVWIKDVCIG